MCRIEKVAEGKRQLITAELGLVWLVQFSVFKKFGWHTCMWRVALALGTFCGVVTWTVICKPLPIINHCHVGVWSLWGKLSFKKQLPGKSTETYKKKAPWILALCLGLFAVSSWVPCLESHGCGQKWMPDIAEVHIREWWSWCLMAKSINNS